MQNATMSAPVKGWRPSVALPPAVQCLWHSNTILSVCHEPAKTLSIFLFNIQH
jgi:hypothetical protein